MNRFSFFRPQMMWLPAAWLFGGLAQAQAPAAPAAAAQPPAGAPTYRSALADYQPYQAQPVQPWGQTNDTVGRIGGWRAYAREAAGAAPAQDKPATSTPAPTQATPPAPDPHAGHHGAKP